MKRKSFQQQKTFEKDFYEEKRKLKMTNLKSKFTHTHITQTIKHNQHRCLLFFIDDHLWFIIFLWMEMMMIMMIMMRPNRGHGSFF